MCVIESIPSVKPIRLVVKTHLKQPEFICVEAQIHTKVSASKVRLHFYQIKMHIFSAS
jgi:hypothetical protein